MLKWTGFTPVPVRMPLLETPEVTEAERAFPVETLFEFLRARATPTATHMHSLVDARLAAMAQAALNTWSPPLDFLPEPELELAPSILSVTDLSGRHCSLPMPDVDAFPLLQRLRPALMIDLDTSAMLAEISEAWFMLHGDHFAQSISPEQLVQLCASLGVAVPHRIFLPGFPRGLEHVQDAGHAVTFEEAIGVYAASAIDYDGACCPYCGAIWVTIPEDAPGDYECEDEHGVCVVLAAKFFAGALPPDALRGGLPWQQTLGAAEVLAGVRALPSTVTVDLDGVRRREGEPRVGDRSKVPLSLADHAMAATTSTRNARREELAAEAVERLRLGTERECCTAEEAVLAVQSMLVDWACMQE